MLILCGMFFQLAGNNGISSTSLLYPAIKTQYNHSYEYVNHGYWYCSWIIGCGIYDIRIVRKVAGLLKGFFKPSLSNTNIYNAFS
jgi:hypothetical protein